MNYWKCVYYRGLFCGRSLAQIVSAGFNAYDVYTDYNYLLTVPIYGNVLYGFLIGTLLLPLLLSMIAGWLIEKDSNQNGPCKLALSLLFGLAIYSGVFPLMAPAQSKDVDSELEEREGGKDEIVANLWDADSLAMATDLGLGCLEDYPQFLL